MMENNMVAVTQLYAGLLAIWFLVLSIRVIMGRAGKGGPSLGDGGDSSMLRRIRGHSNFAEYVPITILLIGLLELSGQAKWVIHALGSMLFVGRVMHGYALAFSSQNVFGRSVGIVLTLVVLGIASVLCLYMGVVGL